MSRDVSLSPKSAELRIGVGSTASEPIKVEVVDEEQNSNINQLGFSSTLSTSFVASEDLSESIDDLTVTKEKKKLRQSKVADDLTRKRKDTTNSITNFFHRFTRGDREEKKIVEEEEEEEHIERPGKLISPESEEKWFESRTLDEQHIGHEGNADVYEWDPNSMAETLVREPPPAESNNTIFEEKGMLKLLEEFRSGELRWLDEPQISAMVRVKEAHEDVSNIHLKIYEIESARRKKREKESLARENCHFSDSDASEEDQVIDNLFEEMNSHMVNMHSALDTVPFYDASKNRLDNDEEYFSS